MNGVRFFLQMIILLQVLRYLPLVKAAPQLDLNSESAVKAAATAMAANLMKYYNPPKTASNGVIFPNTSGGPDGFQWYEGGIMWGALMEYIKTTGDSTYATPIVNALTEASFGKVSSFLGAQPTFAETIEGKWNDDILWWALPVAAGGEIFTANAVMPGGVSYFQLANMTYQQVFAQWSDAKCGGGLYWSRDRNNPTMKGYKSTITHGQEMTLGARLAILSGDSTFLQQGDQMYKWLKSAGIVTADYKVYDGLDEDRGCGINANQLSYKAGFLIGGLAWMFRASGNQFFMDEANKLTTVSLSTFTKNGIITDQCEPKCSENQVSPKGTMIRGLGHVIEFSNDAAVKAQVKTTLANSINAMLKTCDATLNCGAYWNVGAPETSNVHYQTNALELMTAYLKTFKNGPAGANLAPPTTPPSSTKSSKKGGSSAAEISLAATLLTFLGLIA